ncbi:aminoglycoside adenylyltransferase domain-containing protein [Ectobacillus ponti]|uniref:DUF4111 domain-containing protein n=1 Tax=Ectobacillus ponti TaxID=2961894 RepID=A0AA41X2X7_9BACI|nr:aminoglycoside adenylyltransferase domain-containing protein [Ectobacillus ponti]MCP8967637.1 DUF4111 domain-containing protein [Ectobacillus ponti]
MPTLPERVAEVLEEYIRQVDQALPDRLIGLYLYGSVTLGAFQDGKSDIDCIAVMEQAPGEAVLEKLKGVHSRLKQQFPKTDVMGLYMTAEELMAGGDACVSFIDGVFQGYQPFERHSIDAYQLKQYGITVRGRSIAEYDYTIDWEVLLRGMRDNLHTYWAGWRDDGKVPSSERGIQLLLEEAVEWCVLGVSRQYYTFRERDIASKLEAGAYALQHVPERWHPIIREALRIRSGQGQPQYRSASARRRDAVDYMDFLIGEAGG